MVLSSRQCAARCPFRQGPIEVAAQQSATAAAVACRLAATPLCCRSHGRRAPTVAVAAATSTAIGRSSDAAADEARQDADLRRWIQSHGGFVHDSISVTSATQCGSRGLVANAAISLSQLEAQSLVVVPRALHLDNRAAVAAVCPQLGSEARREAFREGLGQLQQVACCLAIERVKGDESFWLPYIRTLPDMPPNPWLLSVAGLEEALEQLAAVADRDEAEAAEVKAKAMDPGDLPPEAEAVAEVAASVAWTAGSGGCRTGWSAATAAARRRYDTLAAEVLEVVAGDSGHLGVDYEGLMWALGQVVSRSLGSGRSSGLLPLIDMANHSSAARPPLMMLDNSDQLVFALTSIRGGELAPLEPGQELFISYQAEGMSPLQAWLKWGFVPHTLKG